MTKEKTCKNCGQAVDKKTVICTSCGVKIKKPLYKKWWFWAVVVIVLIAILASGNSNNEGSDSNVGTQVVENNENAGDGNTDTPTVENNKEEKVKSNSPKITMAEFEALNTGITYEEAVAIIGGAGEVLSQSDIAGYNTVIYMWEGYGSLGANANVTFQNNALVAKAQIGLK